MPLYDYHCVRCGAFRAWGSMCEAGQAMPCPTCTAASPRVISAPNISTVSTTTRTAWTRNDRSAEAPRVVTRPPSAGTL